MDRRRKAALAAAALLLLASWLLMREEAGPPAGEPGGVPVAARGVPPPAASDGRVPPAEPSAPPAPPPAPPADAPPVPAILVPPTPPPAEPGFRRLALEPLPRREPAPPPLLPAPGTDAIRIGGGDAPGGMRPVGWTKWKPVPEKGTAAFSGTVLDAAGRPLPGAEVLRVDPASGGAEGAVISFQHVRTVATTKDDGTFEARDQPARPFLLAANWRAAMNRERGLLLSGSVPVNPGEGGTASGVTIRLPVNPADFGRLLGRVLDDEGSPLGGCQVLSGFQAAWTRADGIFLLDGVPSGTAVLQCRRYGYRPWRSEHLVAAGQAVQVDVVMAPAPAGACDLSGIVVDEGGSGVPAVKVWVGGVEGLSRDTATDATGAFRFRRLPDLGERTVSVSVMADPEKAGVLPATVQGVRLPTEGLRIAVERSVLLRILVRDAATGAVLPLFNVSVERERVVEGAPRFVPYRSATLYEEDGAWDLPVPRGRLALFVEAPDHEPVHAAVEIPRGEAGPFEVLVEMPR